MSMLMMTPGHENAQGTMASSGWTARDDRAMSIAWIFGRSAYMPLRGYKCVSAYGVEQTIDRKSMACEPAGG